MNTTKRTNNKWKTCAIQLSQHRENYNKDSNQQTRKRNVIKKKR